LTIRVYISKFIIAPRQQRLALVPNWKAPGSHIQSAILTHVRRVLEYRSAHRAQLARDSSP